MNRIISKEEEREDPRRDSSIYLRVVFPHSYKNYKISSNTVYSTVFPHAIQQLQVILHTELILLTRNTTTTRLIPCRLLPATVPRVSKHSTRQNKASGPPYSIPRPYSTSRLPVILPGRNSILHGSQHPRSPYSSSQASFQVLHYKNSTRRNRIHSKGLSIVCLCNTKVSVFQFTYSYFRIILQEY